VLWQGDRDNNTRNTSLNIRTNKLLYLSGSEIPSSSKYYSCSRRRKAGKPGQWIRNSNGSFDVGQMQFNTNYLTDLAHYGITTNYVAATGCNSFDLAAWRLRKHIIHDTGDLWTRLANYHSRTLRYNAIYREDLMKKKPQAG
jgi:hypothetical protein